jgi:biotin transport system substrate-specific component
MNIMKSLRPIEITLAAMFVALMAIGANLTSYITIGTVPLSMQPFFAVLAGLLLGSRLGAISMTAYVLVGLVGVPVFAKFGSGIGSFIGAGGTTGGFIISFIFVAFFAGLIVEKGQRNLITYIIAAFVGLTLNYTIGTTYLYYAVNAWAGYKVEYATAWSWMYLFLIKDIIFTFIAATIAPRIFNTIKNTSAYSKLHSKEAA